MPDSTKEERGRLIARLESAHKKITKLHSREMEALIGGDVTAAAAVMAELTAAREERDRVAAELRTHVADHRS